MGVISQTHAISEPPQIKPKRLLKTLQKAGFVLIKQKGSHADLLHPNGRRTGVPMHTRDVPKCTLKAILQQANLSIEELKELL